MAIVAPFRAVAYNIERIPNLESVIAPPYDVITEKEQEEYYQRDPYNVVRLILGKKKTGDSDWDNRYTRAGDLFKRWESEDVLVRLPAPAIYLVSIRYESPETRKTKTLWGFIALAKIEDSDSTVILPHERTFTFHREDRLKLMRACDAQLSPIFGVYTDADDEILSALKTIANLSPMVSFRDTSGYGYRMWQATGKPLLNDISFKLAPKSIIIADGHHRYETARNYRDLMRARFGAPGPVRSYEYAMMFLTNITGKGLTILPTHRLYRSYPDFNIDAFLDSARTHFHIHSFPLDSSNRKQLADTLSSRLHSYGQKGTCIGFYHTGSQHYYLLSLKPQALGAMGDDVHPSLKKVDALVLSRLIFQRILGIRRENLDDEEIIHYESNTQNALSSVLSGESQMVFLVNPTKIEQILEVTGNSLLMPRKSTYFYPKIISGLLFNKIDPRETILHKLPES
ncbi:MAG: DUF1015 domain-containing protein [Thermodesulfobacteriota bacterium]